MNLKSHERWIKEIHKYKLDLSDEEIVKFSLAYTLQSLRKNEDMDRFKWKV